MGYTLRQLTGYSRASAALSAERMITQASAVRAAGQESKDWRKWIKGLEHAQQEQERTHG